MRRRGPKEIPVADWPETDRTAWIAARRPVGPLDSGAGSNWRPATWKAAERGYSVWLGWLCESGDVEWGARPEARITLDRLRAYFQRLEESGIADHTMASHVEGLAAALRAMAPDFDASPVSRAAARMRRFAKPVRDPRARMRPAAEILSLGLELMRGAGTCALPRAKRPIFYRDGLLIAFLILNPVRVASLAAMRLGQQIRQEGEGWVVDLGAADMKAGRAILYDWPSCLVPNLERYLTDFRPALLAGRSGHSADQSALWISSNGVVLDEETLAQAIEVRTRRAFGTHVNPHLFRRIVATEIATYDPDNATDIAAILAHSSIEVSEKHYNFARALEAARAYQALIVDRTRTARLLDEPVVGRRTSRPPTARR